MTTELYDLLSHIHNSIEQHSVVDINTIHFNFPVSDYTLFHTVDRHILQTTIKYVYPESLKLELINYIPVLGALGIGGKRWNGYFSKLYDQFCRIVAIDAILPTL